MIINFLKKLPVFKQVYRQGGIDSFPLAQKDILETMRDDLDKKADEIAKQKLNDLLALVDAHKIVTLDKTHGIVYIGGVKAEAGRLANLRSEAEFFLESDLWQLIYETPKELASRAMFVNGETLSDLQKGKSMLYTLSTQKNIIDTLKSYVDKK
jgi:hypothetical protein